VAVIQSLVRKGEVSDLVAGYGQLIVDECHHLSARSFEQVARRSKARERVPMPELYAALAADEARNTLIVDDVLAREPS
jgi:superfamily II DNA or RNA helicase